jgi:exonuclease VII small subunit
MPEDEPATRADVKNAIQELKIELLERIEKAETNLLTAFRNWSRGAETHQKVNDLLVRSFDDRLAALEERVGELERRRN